MRGRKGGVKGVPIYKTLVIRPRHIKAYYWIQDFIKREGRGPIYREIGLWLGGSDNYYTARNKGINLCAPLEANGFIAQDGHGRGARLRITEKPFTEVNLVVPTDSKPRH